MTQKHYLCAVKMFFTVTFLLCSISLFSQKTVVGKITDGKTNLPLSLATITVKGTKIAVVSEKNGSFQIKVPAKQKILVISSIGFEDYEIDISSTASIEASLTEKTSSLNEVVITGYSSQRKKDILGSVSVVNTKELLANPGPNVESLLQGKAAGVTVGTSGVPGAGASVRIRGFTTFNQNEPLFIVDGARVSSISELNPTDIESLQVLKDASAAAVYGAAAANGVIIISTKRGKGKAKISYDSYYGVQSIVKGFNLLNTAEYGQYLLKLQQGIPGQTATTFNLGQYNGGQSSTATPIIPDYILAGTASGLKEGDPRVNPSLYNLDLNNVEGSYLIVPANKQGTNWFDEITRNGGMLNNNITASGGNETSNYLFGLNYFDQDGTIKFTGYKRYSVRSNTSFNIKKFMKIGENLQVNYIEYAGNFQNQDESNPVSFAYRNQPIIPVFDIAGNFAGTRGSNLGNSANPYANLARSSDSKNSRIGVIGSVFAQIDFLKYFNLRTVLGIDYGNNSGYGFGIPAYENAEGRGGIGNYSEYQNSGYQLTWYNTLGFHKTFAEAHDVNVLVGTEAIQGRGRGVNAANNDYFSFDRNFWQVGSGRGVPPTGGSYEYQFRKQSPIIAKVDYAFNNKYYLSSSYRRDGSSNAFGPNFKFGNFYSASGGWRISEESFLRNKVSWLNDLKLRVGYGILGNDNTQDFGFVTTYAFDSYAAGYPISGTNAGSGAVSGLLRRSLGNPDVKWEQSSTINVGLDATLFNSKLNIILDVYNRQTTGLLYNRQLDPTNNGNLNRQPTNIGDMNNKGIDLSLNYNGNINRDWKYDASVNFSLYRNKVGVIADPFFEGNRSRIDPFNRSTTGEPISYFYGYIVDGFFQNQADMDKIIQSNEGIGKWRYKDISGPNGKPDGAITVDDRTKMGSPHPDFTTGFNFNLSYKNWDFSTFLYWKAGGEIVNYVRYWTDFNTFQGNRDKRVLYDSWTPQNTNAKLPILDASDGASGQVPVSYYVESGSYLRLRNLSLGYTLPVNILNRVGIDRLRFYLQAQNLFTITKYTGLDPEISTQNVGRGDYRAARSDANSLGVDYGNYPTPRIITFGLNLVF